MSDTPTATVTSPNPGDGVADDAMDERLIRSQGLGGYLSDFVARLRGGDLGNLPVVLGLLVILVVFYALEPRFLSSYQLMSMTQFAAPLGMISLGIVLVLLLGEIDLSVGSVSGLAAATSAILVVNDGLPTIVGLVAGLLVGTVIGCFYALLYTRIGVPSFVFSLAGFLGFQGALFFVLGDNGTINIPRDDWLVQFTRQQFVSGVAAYLLVVVVVALYAGSQLYGARRRRAAGLTPPPMALVAVKSGAMLVGLLFLSWYLAQANGQGWGYVVLLFVALVVAMDLLLRKTRWGRHVYAVGGNVEAARRSGINVTAIYVSVFAACSTFAALGGLFMAAQLTSVSQNSGTSDTNLTAIAAAVIGGTSLFGGRGTAYAALLGVLVLQAIQSGLNIIGVDSSVRFMVTGAVLLLAVAIDSVTRRMRTASGRG